MQLVIFMINSLLDSQICVAEFTSTFLLEALHTISIICRLLSPFLMSCFSITLAFAAYESAISFYNNMKKKKILNSWARVQSHYCTNWLWIALSRATSPVVLIKLDCNSGRYLETIGGVCRCLKVLIIIWTGSIWLRTVPSRSFVIIPPCSKNIFQWLICPHLHQIWKIIIVLNVYALINAILKFEFW